MSTILEIEKELILNTDEIKDSNHVDVTKIILSLCVCIWYMTKLPLPFFILTFPLITKRETVLLWLESDWQDSVSSSSNTTG